jgi:hypothetical protein
VHHYSVSDWIVVNELRHKVRNSGSLVMWQLVCKTVGTSLVWHYTPLSTAREWYQDNPY